MSGVSRLSAKEVWEGVQAGSLLLVCAYDEDEKFQKNKLEGAIPLTEFKANLSGYDRNGRIAFY